MVSSSRLRNSTVFHDKALPLLWSLQTCMGISLSVLWLKDKVFSVCARALLKTPYSLEEKKKAWNGMCTILMGLSLQEAITAMGEVLLLSIFLKITIHGNPL